MAARITIATNIVNVEGVPGQSVELSTQRRITILLNPEEGVSVVYFWNEGIFTLSIKG